MRIEYFKSPVGNFGDDLNPWLWPRLFPGAFESDGDEVVFIGIGSILDGRFSGVRGRKVVFGAGARSAGTVPAVDPSWDIRFVRGPMTASALGLDPSYAVTDGAAALALLGDFRRAGGQGAVGLMPHYHSMPQVDWEGVCASARLRLIDPRWDVDRVLAALRSVDRLITEAMHGAIVADTLRVPWFRIRCHSALRETPAVAEFKWRDWGGSLEVDTSAFEVGRVRARSARPLIASLRWPIRRAKELLIARRLKHVRDSDGFRLSDEAALGAAIDRVSVEVRRIRETSSATAGSR